MNVSSCPRCGGLFSQEEPARCPACALALAGDEGATLPPAEDRTVPQREAATLPLGALADASSPRRGQVPGYEVLDELGRGGMGVVYLARHLKLNRMVALKMILAGAHAGEDDLARFKTEAEAIARLQHPHIVQVYEVGEHDGSPFCALELCGAGSLEKSLGGKPLPPAEAARLTVLLARAVHHAHQHNIVHRDLKPANVLLVGEPDAPLVNCQPKITDFGLAKLLDVGATQTRTGAVMGTPSYMAPEQAGGKTGTIGPAADVYSLGAILYELLTGKPPFKAESAIDTLMQVVGEEPLPPRQLCPAIGRDLEAICLKCLEKQPGSRYASAADLADDLERFLRGEAALARPVGPLGRLARWAQKRPALAATLCGLSLFYVDHLVLIGLGLAEGDDFHWFVTYLLGCWALGAIVLQWLMNRPGWRWPATYGWAAFDVGMFTALLLRADGTKSALLVCYLLLIAGAALRFRLRLVWFVTGLCLASYLVLLADARWRRPQENLLVEVPIAIIFLLSLLLMGVVMTLLLRRFRLALAQER